MRRLSPGAVRLDSTSLAFPARTAMRKLSVASAAYLSMKIMAQRFTYLLRAKGDSFHQDINRSTVVNDLSFYDQH